MSFVVVDIETTGLSRHYNRITEVAALRINKGVIKKEFQSLVNPQQIIPKFITRLTGIDNELVKDAPTIKEVIPEIKSFLGESVFVAHNASFDFGFLNHNAIKHNKISIENPRLCTVKLANRLLPELPSKKLSCLCDYFEIEDIKYHRAMSDAIVTSKIFNNFLGMLDEKGLTEIDQILKFESSPRKTR